MLAVFMGLQVTFGALAPVVSGALPFPAGEAPPLALPSPLAHEGLPAPEAAIDDMIGEPPRALSSPAMVPSPTSFGVGTPENWSPYAPSAFTFGQVSLTTGGNAANFTGAPNFTVNVTGDVRVGFNGSWNPRPGLDADRDWVMIVIVLNGRADVSVLESNTSRIVTLGSGQLPALVYFVLPSARGYASPTSSASSAFTPPGGNLTRINLTFPAAALDLSGYPTALQIATKSVWVNSSGFYNGNGVLSGPQNVSVLLPLDDQPVMAIHRGEVRQWTGAKTFPGARLFLLHGGGGIIVISNIEVSLWTRGSPESGLFVNATYAAVPAYRGDTHHVSGTAGNRSLVASTNWSANTTAQAAATHTAESCTALVRLINGSFRLFCRVSDTDILLVTKWGVVSAFSRDGTQWAWEPGVRYQLCSGDHSINELAIVRTPTGLLRMYYSGQGTLLGCPGGTSTHLSSATSIDDGANWALESENIAIGYGSPDVRAVVPTPDGNLRMYLDSGSGFVSATSSDGAIWNNEASLAGSPPRAVYLLSDGGYKMYLGTTDVSSSTSADGLTWSAPTKELVRWSSFSIEAGPIVDRGDGTLAMLVFSQTDGLFLAVLRNVVVVAARLTVTGTNSEGKVFDTAAGAATDAGAFLINLTIPASTPIGRVWGDARAWFGGPRTRGVVLNRLPVWSGPATLTATEDQDAVYSLSSFLSDADSADTPTLNVTGPFAVFAGGVVTLNYPNGVLSSTLNGSAFDAYDKIAFTILVTVTPWDDDPTLNLNASYPAVEDSASPVDFSAAVADEETPDGLLNLSTNASGALTAGTTISFLFTTPGAHLVNISVNDGNHTVNGTTVIMVSAVDDPPILSLLPEYTGVEDTPIILDFTAEVFDEDTSPPTLRIIATNLSGAGITGLTLTLSRSSPGVEDFYIDVDDGTNAPVRGFTRLNVTPVNDPPVWDTNFRIQDAFEDVPYFVDAAAFVTDDDNLSSTLTFSVTSIYAQFNGSMLEMVFPETVTRVFLDLTVSDGRTVVAYQLRVDIEPVNDAPALVGTPPANSPTGANVSYQFGATDIDDSTGFTYELAAGESFITVSSSGLLTITPPVGDHRHVNYTVRVADSHGAFSVPVNFTFALPFNHPPVMLPDFTALSADGKPNIAFTIQFTVVDTDLDPIALNLSWNDSSQTLALVSIGPGAYELRWTPTYTYTPSPAGFFANLTGNLTLYDGFVTVDFPFRFVAKDPPDERPSIVGTIPAIHGQPGVPIVIDLTPYMRDDDDGIDRLTWSFDGSIGSFADEPSYNPTTHRLTLLFTGTGSGSLRFTLSDPSHLNDTQPVFVESTAPGTTGGGATGFPWWLLLVLVAGAGGGLVYARSRMRPSPGSLSPAEEVATKPAPPPESAPARAVPPVGTRQKRTFLVEDLFLLYKDGRTIFTRGGLSADAVEDADSVGSMLVAVQDFVHDSFKRGSPVDRMGYGDNVILIEKGESVILAVTVFGEPDREFRELLTETVRQVEMSFAGIIEAWDGSRTSLAGVDKILAPVWMLTADLTRGDVLLATTAREVQMLSGVEFFQGFVRLKVGIVNNTPSVITNVTVDLDFNADVLRLHKIEPGTYKTAGAKVNLGVLHTGEKSTLAYYFDPQICTSSAIDGSCRYKDHEGNQHIVQMKSRKAEVVCPLFFTKEQANTAMLKRLVETELRQYDVRAFSFAERTGEPALGPLFEALKSTVMAHDVQTVRSFERRRPYFAEAWFYGKTQVKGYPMVIRAVVDSERRRAEFFVASTAMRAVTGLLAELSRTFQTTAAPRFAEVGLVPLFDETLRDAYADPAAVSKMVEGEAAPGDNEPGPRGSPG